MESTALDKEDLALSGSEVPVQSMALEEAASRIGREKGAHRIGLAENHPWGTDALRWLANRVQVPRPYVSTYSPASARVTMRCCGTSQSCSLKQRTISAGWRLVVLGDCSSGMPASASGRR